MSSKRKKRGGQPAKSGSVWRQSADEATLAQNPRYNGFACGYGAHGDRKFNRAKANRAWKAQVRQEGASRGSFPFYRDFAKNRVPCHVCGHPLGSPAAAGGEPCSWALTALANSRVSQIYDCMRLNEAARDSLMFASAFRQVTGSPMHAIVSE